MNIEEAKKKKKEMNHGESVATERQDTIAATWKQALSQLRHRANLRSSVLTVVLAMNLTVSIAYHIHNYQDLICQHRPLVWYIE